MVIMFSIRKKNKLAQHFSFKKYCKRSIFFKLNTGNFNEENILLEHLTTIILL